MAAFAATCSRSRTKARIMKMLMCVARLLLSTFAAIKTPCSVNTRGRLRVPPREPEIRVENHPLVTHKQNQWLKRFLSDSIILPWHPRSTFRQVTRRDGGRTTPRRKRGLVPGFRESCSDPFFTTRRRKRGSTRTWSRAGRSRPRSGHSPRRAARRRRSPRSSRARYRCHGRGGAAHR